MIDKVKVKDIVEEYLLNTDTFLVDVIVNPGNIIIVEIDSFKGVGLQDCVKLTKFIESKLDREIEDYELEVGSSGVASAFKIRKQYEKNIGNEVEVLTKKGIKLSGILKSCESEDFVVTITKMQKPEGGKRKIEVKEDLTFKYEEVKHTKYLIRFK